jgi:hypothetical protein
VEAKIFTMPGGGISMSPALFLGPIITGLAWGF